MEIDAAIQDERAVNLISAQVVATSKGDGVDYDVGDWRDTITLPTPGNVTVRFQAKDFDGPSLAHCHIFSHADLGMLHAFSIQPAA